MSDETPDARTRRVLEEHGLPPGLLPEGIEDGDVEDDGAFWVQLPRQVVRRHGGYKVRFATRISGVVSDGAVDKLRGVEAKQVMWFPVGRITTAAGALDFHVGPVTKRLPVSEFPFAGA